MKRRIFVNLPVKDLKKTVAFFTKLGFKFNPKLTDENSACMIIEDNIFAMLMVEKFFKTFIKKEMADARKTTGGWVNISAESRGEVDKMAKDAVAAGGKEVDEPSDYGWMYSRAIE